MEKLPAKMKAIWYDKPEQFSLQEVDVPQIKDDEVLVKVRASGVCGTDLHIHEGEFIAEFPLIPGHETVGVIAAIGPKVTQFKIGDRIVADNSELCGSCFYCRRGEPLYCEHFKAHGVLGMHGGLAEYVSYRQEKVFHIKNLTDVEATLIEPASCAIHGMDKIRPPIGASVLMIGAGPTGLVLAQLLRQNGASHLTLAANKGLKMDLAKNLGCADVYINLDRQNPQLQWEQIKKDHPYGFDIVVEATGSPQICQDAINYVRRGGTLVVYGVYSAAARVTWPPSKIFGDEIKIIGSFSETFCFDRAIEYLDSKKVKVDGIVNCLYKLEDYDKALEDVKNKRAIKAAVVFPGATGVPNGFF